jgi:hypothetical protein
MDGGEGFITTLLAIFFCVNKQKSVFGGSADIRKSRTASSGAGQLAYTSRRARSSCAAVLDFGHPVGGEIQEQAGLEGGLEANKP